MGLIATLGRIPKILEANINDLLDKCEDPDKMIEQLLRDYREDLAEVKKDTAAVIADMEIAKENLDKQKAYVAKLTTAAENALKQGQEQDALKIISQKQTAEVGLKTLQETYDLQVQNAEAMKAGYNKLVDDIQTLEQRKNNIKAQNALANAMEHQAKVADTGKAQKALDKFSQYEEKAARRLAEARASQDLDSHVDTAEELADKYANAGNDVDANAELTAMKQRLGL